VGTPKAPYQEMMIRREIILILGILSRIQKIENRQVLKFLLSNT